jgi:tetratricopeptide (TPR) repeat protein
MRRFLATALFCVVPVIAHAMPSEDDEKKAPAAGGPDGSEYQRGVRARIVQDWVTAVEAFRRVVDAQVDFAAAWNELGFALRQLGRYPESLDAYGEALRLRPDFAEALEYLGEAYVKLGRVAEARKILDRLRPLDARRAQELAEVIDKAK